MGCSNCRAMAEVKPADTIYESGKLESLFSKANKNLDKRENANNGFLPCSIDVIEEGPIMKIPPTEPEFIQKGYYSFPKPQIKLKRNVPRPPAPMIRCPSFNIKSNRMLLGYATKEERRPTGPIFNEKELQKEKGEPLEDDRRLTNFGSPRYITESTFRQFQSNCKFNVASPRINLAENLGLKTADLKSLFKTSNRNLKKMLFDREKKTKQQTVKVKEHSNSISSKMILVEKPYKESITRVTKHSENFMSQDQLNKEQLNNRFKSFSKEKQTIEPSLGNQGRNSPFENCKAQPAKRTSIEQACLHLPVGSRMRKRLLSKKLIPSKVFFQQHLDAQPPFDVRKFEAEFLSSSLSSDDIRPQDTRPKATKRRRLSLGNVLSKRKISLI